MGVLLYLLLRLQGSQGDQRTDRGAPGRSASQAEEEHCPEPVKKAQHRSSTQHHNHRSGTSRGLSRQETLDSETQESRDSAYAEPKEEYSHEHADTSSSSSAHSKSVTWGQLLVWLLQSS